MRWARLRSLWQRWWQGRHPLTDNWQLTQRNVYILPTKAGIVFAITLLIMLLASINYQLNLGYVLTFLLMGAGLMSIHLTHATLRGLTLRMRPATPVFAGEAAALDIVLINPGAARHALAIHFHDRQAGGAAAAASSGAGAGSSAFAWCDVPALGQTNARVSIVPQHRGWHALPTLVIETVFPFGLFRAWTLWRPAVQLLAYPRPEQPAPPLPQVQAAPGERPLPHAPSGNEMDGVRPWRRGDSMRQVAWKKVARTGEMVSRDTAASGSRELWLDWSASAGQVDVEQRLSRMAAWVLTAERSGMSYGLRMPGNEQSPGHGEPHRRAALEALALW